MAPVDDDALVDTATLSDDDALDEVDCDVDVDVDEDEDEGEDDDIDPWLAVTAPPLPPPPALSSST